MSSKETSRDLNGDVLFEVSEEEFERCPSRRRAVFGTLFFGSFAAIEAGLFAWSLATGLLVGFNALLFVPPFLVVVLAVVLAVYIQYRSLRRLNRFGIFIGGIAPPLRPRGSRLGDSGRLVIPFTSIARVEYLRYGEGPEYLAHFGAMVESSDGIRIAINDTMISGQVGRDPERLREAQRILERLAQRFGLQRQEGPATN